MSFLLCQLFSSNLFSIQIISYIYPYRNLFICTSLVIYILTIGIPFKLSLIFRKCLLTLYIFNFFKIAFILYDILAFRILQPFLNYGLVDFSVIICNNIYRFFLIDFLILFRIQAAIQNILQIIYIIYFILTLTLLSVSVYTGVTTDILNAIMTAAATAIYFL